MVYVDKTAGERQRRYRQRVAMENETRGRSILNPKSFKKDMTVQAWMDSRYIATLSRYLDNEYRTKYLSEVLQEGIRILVDHLVKAGQIEMVEGSAEAREELEWKYRIDLSKYRRKGAKNSAHNDALVERVRDNRIDHVEIDEPDRDDIGLIDSGAVDRVAKSRMFREAKEREARERETNPNPNPNIINEPISEDDRKARINQERDINMPIMPQAAPVKLDE